MTRLELYIRKSKPVVLIVNWLKKVYLPGFEGVSLFDSLNFFQKQIFSSRFNYSASAVSFSFLMALPPLLLFFFTLIPYLPLPENKIIEVLNEMLLLLTPNENMQKSVTKLISDFITHKKNALLSFSIILTIFYSSNGVMGLMKSFDKNIKGFKKRTAFIKRLIAIALTFQLIFSIILTLGFMIAQAWLFKALNIQFITNSIVLNIIAYLLIIGMILLTVACLYRFGYAAITHLKLINPGAIIATFLIILLTVGFFYVVNNLVNYNKIYGSIGTLIVFMVWVNLIAQILLIGFELNASIITNKIESKNEKK